MRELDQALLWSLGKLVLRGDLTAQEAANEYCAELEDPAAKQAVLDGIAERVRLATLYREDNRDRADPC